MILLEKINAELNRLFDLFNKHYYSGEIRKPVIVAQTNGHNAGAMGWCTCNKVWKDNSSLQEDGTSHLMQKGKNQRARKGERKNQSQSNP